MPDHRVVVIGAGMAGLVSALQLAHQGLDVTVLESSDSPGGKIRQPIVDGAAIDSGPTVFTMRWVFDEILASVGTQLESELHITALSVLARHFWADGSALDLYADSRQSMDAVGRFAGAAEARRFEGFCQTAREVYRALEGPFIRGSSPTLMGLGGALGARGLATLARIGPMRSLWDSLGHHFHDRRLRQLFARYATYCGSSPWLAPATLMLIAQVELDGVWSVQGGMHELARCLARLAQARGARLRYGCRCERIEISQGRVSAVLTAAGERLPADSVVFNGDMAALRTGLLGPELRKAAPAKVPQRSLSALTWSIHAPTQGPELDRHNVFFQNDYASEFEDIFSANRLPRRPTVYVCAQDRGTGPSPQGPERLLCLVNAPAYGDQTPSAQTDEELLQCQTHSFDLMRRCGLSIEAQPHQILRTTPQDFHRMFPATGGALYGQATHGWMSAFARPGANSPVPGLYLAGGSVHPGPGVPMAALSGRLAAAALMASPALTSRSRRAATSGGTSTP
ncbi:MAG: 1-hydroxycarotenoid 3,4-desaturase CrtD [Betaproteobacteria bacterium]